MRALLFSLLLLPLSLSRAISLNSFQWLQYQNPDCVEAYSGDIHNCAPDDFGAASTCSSLCIHSLGKLEGAIAERCQDDPIESDTLVHLALNASMVYELCPNNPVRPDLSSLYDRTTESFVLGPSTMTAKTDLPPDVTALVTQTGSTVLGGSCRRLTPTSTPVSSSLSSSTSTTTITIGLSSPSSSQTPATTTTTHTPLLATDTHIPPSSSSSSSSSSSVLKSSAAAAAAAAAPHSGNNGEAGGGGSPFDVSASSGNQTKLVFGGMALTMMIMMIMVT